MRRPLPGRCVIENAHLDSAPLEMPNQATLLLLGTNMSLTTMKMLNGRMTIQRSHIRVYRGLMVFLMLEAGVIAQPATPADRFLDTLDQRTAIPAEARSLIRRAWEECGTDCDGQELLLQGLTLASERFRAGLDAYDRDDYSETARIMHDLSVSDDPFVAANARAFEIKALVQGDRLLEAGVAIVRALSDEGVHLSTYSYLAPEIEFLRGYCLLSDVQYDKAAEALEAFLRKYPDASQRLTVSAQQMLLELRNRQPEKIGDVVDLMNFCGRRLALVDAGDTVQSRQDRILDLLDQMIEEAERNEQKNNAGGSGSGSSGSRSPQNPMQESTLPGGAGGDEEPDRASRRANPGEMWGAMPPAERERVMQALRESFPQRYRRLVEQYYEELAKKP